MLALAVSAALPQDPVLKTRTKEEREEQFNITHRITMNVQVTDASGTPVSDLRAGISASMTIIRRAKLSRFIRSTVRR